MTIEQITNRLEIVEIIMDLWGGDAELAQEQKDLKKLLIQEQAKEKAMLNVFVSQEEKAAKELWEIKQQLKELKKVEDKLIEELKRAANGKTTSFGEYIFLLKSRKGNVQYAHIPELDDVDLEAYRAPEIQYFELNKL